jgi:hypothetical protein
MSLWAIKPADAAAIFGGSVTEDDVREWRHIGVPTSYRQSLIDLTKAADELARRVRRDRIAAVVRRPIASEGNRSVLTLAMEGGHARVAAVVTATFDLREIQP